MSLDSIPHELTERFRLGEIVYVDPTGTLIRAESVESGRSGVLKIVDPSLAATASERQRLKRELVKQSTLNVPSLALPTLTGESEGKIWYFRDWLEGESLRDRLAREGTIPAGEALRIASRLAEALDELHRAGLLHRDLKPELILLTPNPVGGSLVVTTGAGLAPRMKTESAFHLVGTPEYVSPEQASGKLVSFRSDLYALGCVLYEMLEGKPPFAGATVDDLLAAHAEAEPPPMPTGIPEPARELMANLLAKDPRERPFSAQQVSRALGAVTGEVKKARPKATLLGMPAMPSPGARPPGPPTSERVPAPSRPPPPPGTPMAVPVIPQAAPVPAAPREVTQQVAFDDIIESHDIQKAERARAAASPQAPAEVTQQVALDDIIEAHDVQKAAKAAAAGEAGEAGGLGRSRTGTLPPPAPVDPRAESPGLAYDDLPETVASDLPSVLAGMQPAIEPPPEAVPEEPVQASLPAEPPQAEPSASALPMQYAQTLEQPVTSPPAQEPADPSNEGALPAPIELPAQGEITTPAQAIAPVHGAAAYGTADGATQPQGWEARPAEEVLASASGAASSSIADPAQAAAQTEPSAPSQGESGDTAAIPGLTPSRRPWLLPAAILLLLLFVVAAMAIVFLGREDSPPELASAGLPSASAPQPSPTSGAPSAAPAAPLAPKPTAVVAPEPAPAPEAASADAGAASAEAASAEAAESEAAEAASAEAASAEAAESEAAEAPSSTRATMRASMRASMAAAAAGGTQSPFEQARAEALEHFRARRFPQAAAAYQRATSINPRHAGSFAGLGAARLAMNDARGAVAAYQRAVQLQPNHSGFFAALGRAYASAGDRARARQAYQRALALNPNNATAERALGSL